MWLYALDYTFMCKPHARSMQHRLVGTIFLKLILNSVKMNHFAIFLEFICIFVKYVLPRIHIIWFLIKLITSNFIVFQQSQKGDRNRKKIQQINYTKVIRPSNDWSTTSGILIDLKNALTFAISQPKSISEKRWSSYVILKIEFGTMQILYVSNVQSNLKEHFFISSREVYAVWAF